MEAQRQDRIHRDAHTFARELRLRLHATLLLAEVEAAAMTDASVVLTGRLHPAGDAPLKEALAETARTTPWPTRISIQLSDENATIYGEADSSGNIQMERATPDP